MGRPGTPGPGERAAGETGESRATFSGAVVLLGIVSFVLGVIAVAVPYWGHFRPPGAGSQLSSRTHATHIIITILSYKSKPEPKIPRKHDLQSYGKDLPVTDFVKRKTDKSAQLAVPSQTLCLFSPKHY